MSQNPYPELLGHWFCSYCNDVIPNVRKPYGRWDAKQGQPCPVCHNRSMDWVGDSPTPPKRASVSPERAHDLFELVRKGVVQ